jgi:hypothetical protein
METIEIIPDPISLLESMRAVGYTVETAIADIIDNSVSKEAKNIYVIWDPSNEPYIAILDDGVGMTSEELTNAMRHGNTNPNKKRSEIDLGRFGLGMKTASLSQCRKLTVVSKKNNVLSALSWDLDLVAERRKWIVRIPDLEEFSDLRVLDKLIKNKSGTIVIWQKLDRLLAGSDKPLEELTSKLSRLGDHLALVFHRFIKPDSSNIEHVTIKLNGQNVPALDPFLKSKAFKQPLEKQTIKHPLGNILVSPFILPPVNDLSRDDIELAGGREGLRSSQGFYIYRNKRLLIWGTWFKLINKEEFYKLARVQVDIPNSFDELWSLDIKKSSVYPPTVIKSRLRDLLPNFVQKSKGTIVFAGRKEVTGSTNQPWSRIEAYGKIRYIPNIDNQVITKLIEKLDKNKESTINSLFDFISSTLPMQSIYADMSMDDSNENVKIDIDELVGNIKVLMQITGMDLQQLLELDPFINYKSLHTDIIKKITAKD